MITFLVLYLVVIPLIVYLVLAPFLGTRKAEPQRELTKSEMRGEWFCFGWYCFWLFGSLSLGFVINA